MIKKKYTPKNILKEYIDCIWISKRTTKDLQIDLFPGTGAEMYFITEGAFKKEDKKLDQILFMSIRNKKVDFIISENTTFIAVRFKFSAIQHFCNIPITDIFDSIIPANEIWNRDIENIKTSLNKNISVEQKIINIKEFLEKQLRVHQKRTYIHPSEIKYIYKSPEERKITKIAKDNNLSIRQFEKRFKLQIGIPAKKFQSLSRFQNIIKYYIFNKTTNYLPKALESGYYDQAHFIKDFKNKTQQTPTEFLRNLDKTTHFYNNKQDKSTTFDPLSKKQEDDQKSNCPIIY